MLLSSCHGPPSAPATAVDARDDAALARFTQRVHDTLQQNPVGWAYEIRRGGVVQSSAAGGYAVAPIDDARGQGVAFTVDTRMHVASLSKVITALAVAHCCVRNGHTLQEPLARFLPSAWKVHQSFATATLADALEMRTGIGGELDAASSGFAQLQELIENGADPDTLGKFDYRNTSYALFRSIVPYMDGYAEPASRNPYVIDRQTSAAFIGYVQRWLLEPIGIEGASCTDAGASASVLMYAYPFRSKIGTPSGYRAPDAFETDLSRFCGGFGWYLSTRDVGKLVDALEHRTEHTWREAMAMASACFPLRVREGKLGAFWQFSGSWNASYGTGDESWSNGLATCALRLPGELQVVAFTNSRISDESSLHDFVREAYEETFAR